MPFDHRHYVPLVLTKRGEMAAIRDLSATTRSQITPLFVVSSIDWDYVNSAPKKTPLQHLSPLPATIADRWGPDPAFVDTVRIPAGTVVSGVHPLAFVIAEANSSGATLVPVLSPGRDSAYRRAAADAVIRDGRGACFRLGRNEWPSAAGPAPITQLLIDLGLTASDVDLVLDVGPDVLVNPTGLTTAVVNELTNLPHVHDWRTLTVASAGFPDPLSVLRGLHTIPRADWILHGHILGRTLPRKPSFGDYVISGCDPKDLDGRKISISAQLRYTLDNGWLIAKGGLFKGKAGSGTGRLSVPPVARSLAADGRFAGAAHCAGDRWIASVAAGAASGANAERWRRVGTTHHITHVAQAAASLP